MRASSNLILILMTLVASASQASSSEPFKRLPRYFAHDPSSHEAPVYKLPEFGGQKLQNCEAYLFKDTHAYQTLQTKDRSGKTQLDERALTPYQEAALLFDRVIYPKFLAIFPKEFLDPGLPQITLIFDELDPDSVHKGYVSRRYPAENGIYAMVLDARLIGKPEFSLVAAHELQHIFNLFFSIQNHASTPQQDWLNEGLSQFTEFYISGNAPLAALGRISSQGKTLPIAQWPEDSEITDAHYANAFLWISYLYYHFGRNELLWRLIAKPHTGIESVIATLSEMNGKYFNVPAQFLSFQSLFANYSLALAINSKTTGSNRLFSITDDVFVTDLSSFTVKPAFALLPMSESLEPMQAVFLKPSEVAGCLNLNAPNGVYAYLIESILGTSHVTRIARIEDGTCMVGGAQTSHEVVLFNKTSSRQDYSLSLFFPLQ